MAEGGQLEEVVARLESHQRERGAISWENPRGLPKAAVLIALQIRNGEFFVILTRRAETLGTYAGQVALPGGKEDESMDCSAIDTALREAGEEIGLCARQGDVINVLEPLISRTGMVVHPVVALVGAAFRPIPNPEEVSHVFTVPLALFLRRDAYSRRHADWPEGPYLVHEFHHQTHRIWAMTANILIYCASIAFGTRPDFDFDYKQYQINRRKTPAVLKSKL